MVTKTIFGSRFYFSYFPGFLFLNHHGIFACDPGLTVNWLRAYTKIAVMIVHSKFLNISAHTHLKKYSNWHKQIRARNFTLIGFLTQPFRYAGGSSRGPKGTQKGEGLYLTYLWIYQSVSDHPKASPKAIFYESISLSWLIRLSLWNK